MVFAGKLNDMMIHVLVKRQKHATLNVHVHQVIRLALVHTEDMVCRVIPYQQLNVLDLMLATM